MASTPTQLSAEKTHQPERTRLPASGSDRWRRSGIRGQTGAQAAAVRFWLMGFLWEKLRGVEAMGFGDVKMMLMVGAYIGWRAHHNSRFSSALERFAGRDFLMLKARQSRSSDEVALRNFPGRRSIVSLLVGTRIIEWYAIAIRIGLETVFFRTLRVPSWIVWAGR